MSAGSRNTQGGQHGAHLPVLDAHIVSVAGREPNDSERSGALRVVPRVQDEGKAPFYGTCNGPTGRCLLALGHEGDHVRPEVVPVGKVQTRCSWCGRLICAGPLVNGLESHGLHAACRERIR